MLSLLFGVIVLGGSTCTLWYFLPHGGKPHPLARKPLLDSAIPVCIVTGLGIGVALVVSGLVDLVS